jgi:hypothetical protein
MNTAVDNANGDDVVIAALRRQHDTLWIESKRARDESPMATASRVAQMGQLREAMQLWAEHQQGANVSKQLIGDLARRAGFNPVSYTGANLALFEEFVELIVPHLKA